MLICVVAEEAPLSVYLATKPRVVSDVQIYTFRDFAVDRMMGALRQTSGNHTAGDSDSLLWVEGRCLTWWWIEQK
jgi:hypothetical protein